MLDKDYYAAVDDYNKAIITGIVKIAAKMGISTIQSYQGAKIFEAIGINSDVIDKYFKGTVSRIEGVSLRIFRKMLRHFTLRHLIRLDFLQILLLTAQALIR